jgi:hypothetical protein
VRYLRPHWPRLLLLAVLLVAGIAGQLLAPQFIRSFLDTATSRRERSSFVWSHWQAKPAPSARRTSARSSAGLRPTHCAST